MVWEMFFINLKKKIYMFNILYFIKDSPIKMALFLLLLFPKIMQQ